MKEVWEKQYEEKKPPWNYDNFDDDFLEFFKGKFYKKIVIWPDSMKHKDINDMIMAGYTKKQIQEIIDDNTFSGVAAQLRFAEWKKIDEKNMEKTIRRKDTAMEL